jgi:hypothetical protein
MFCVIVVTKSRRDWCLISLKSLWFISISKCTYYVWTAPKVEEYACHWYLISPRVRGFFHRSSSFINYCDFQSFHRLWYVSFEELLAAFKPNDLENNWNNSLVSDTIKHPIRGHTRYEVWERLQYTSEAQFLTNISMHLTIVFYHGYTFQASNTPSVWWFAVPKSLWSKRMIRLQGGGPVCITMIWVQAYHMSDMKWYRWPQNSDDSL